MNRSAVLCAATLIACIYPGLLAQTAQRSQRATRKATPAPTAAPTAAPTPIPTPTAVPYSNELFDPTLPDLPPQFRGASLQQLTSAVATAPKGEFETTAQYEARTKPTLGGVIYGFVLEPGNAFLKYDADVQTFRLQIVLDFGVSIGYKRDYNSKALVISRAEVSRREYEASNAYGAKATVSSTHHNIYALLPTNLRSNTITAEVPASLDVAPSLKPSLRVLAVFECSGASDAVVSGVYHLEPEISSPVETFHHYTYLRGTLLSIWVYSQDSGRILGKFSQ